MSDNPGPSEPAKKILIVEIHDDNSLYILHPNGKQVSVDSMTELAKGFVELSNAVEGQFNDAQ